MKLPLRIMRFLSLGFIACLCWQIVAFPSSPLTWLSTFSLKQKAIEDAYTTINREYGRVIKAKLKDSGIIPDVLDDFDPSVAIHVAYPSKHKNVELGNKLKPKAVQSPPVMSLEVLPSKTTASHPTYVLALTDPDATSRADPVKGQMCHWIIANITLGSGQEKDLTPLLSAQEISSQGQFKLADISEIMSYYPPAPPPKTGYHRYVFVLMSTSSGNSRRLNRPGERPHWGFGKIGAGVREWAEENYLEIVGANFFYSQNKKQ